MLPRLEAPFPWFGGKRRVAHLVWKRFGEVQNYVEPFFGSGAVLLGAPRITPIETVNDADGFVANFWRAMVKEPVVVAEHADWPVNENDLHARHAYLTEIRDSLVSRLEGDPDYYDPLIAGWWVWGISAWIGGGFCHNKGPWHRINSKLIKCKITEHNGVRRQLPHLGNAGVGVHRTLHSDHIAEWFKLLQNRLRRVRVCCGDWSRVCGPAPTYRLGLTGVFLDPPYDEETGRDMRIYNQDAPRISRKVREWCIENQGHERLRVALCGYEGEHVLPGWEKVAWKADGGYANQAKDHDNPNAKRERIWFSPHCLKGRKLDQLGLF